MMPHWLSVLVLLAIGAGLLAVAHHGYVVGELRAGTNFLRGVYRPNREDNPLAFRFFLMLYFSAGLVLCVWGLLALLGMDKPKHNLTVSAGSLQVQAGSTMTRRSHAHQRRASI